MFWLQHWPSSLCLLMYCPCMQGGCIVHIKIKKICANSIRCRYTAFYYNAQFLHSVQQCLHNNVPEYCLFLEKGWYQSANFHGHPVRTHGTKNLVAQQQWPQKLFLTVFESVDEPKTSTGLIYSIYKHIQYKTSANRQICTHAVNISFQCLCFGATEAAFKKERKRRVKKNEAERGKEKRALFRNATNLNIYLNSIFFLI